MSKLTQSIGVIAALGLVSACNHKKEPIDNYSAYRDDVRKHADANKAKAPQVIEKPVYIKGDQKDRIVEVPVDRWHKPETQVVQQKTVDGSFISMSVNRVMSFTEGILGEYPIQVSYMDPKENVSFSVNVNGKLVSELKSGEGIVKKSDGGYAFRWTPQFNIIPNGEHVSTFEIEILAQVADSANTALKQTLKSVVRKELVSVLLYRTKQAPHDMKITRVDQQDPHTIIKGENVEFEIIATVPGIDDKSALPPRLDVSYDNQQLTQGQDYLERNGAPYLQVPAGKPTAVYLQNNTWKFPIVFNASSFYIPPQLGKDGQVITSSEATNMRFVFTVINDLSKTEAPKKVHQLRVVTAPAPAAASPPVGSAQPAGDMLEAPQFNLQRKDDSQAFTLIPGSNQSLAFQVVAKAGEQIKVQFPDSSAIMDNLSSNCVASNDGEQIQNCKMSWTTSCSASADAFPASLRFAAQAVQGSRSSELKNLDLPIQRAKKTNRCKK